MVVGSEAPYPMRDALAPAAYETPALKTYPQLSSVFTVIDFDDVCEMSLHVIKAGLQVLETVNSSTTIANKDFQIDVDKNLYISRSDY